MKKQRKEMKELRLSLKKKWFEMTKAGMLSNMVKELNETLH